jgi:hypothetical protein
MATRTRRGSPAQLDRELDIALGPYYLTECSPTSAPLDEPRFTSRRAAKSAAARLVRTGKYRAVEVWHQWEGGNYMQGIATRDGWSDV